MSEPAGKIILSCGCEFTDDMGDMDGLYVRFRDQVCDAVDGLMASATCKGDGEIKCEPART